MRQGHARREHCIMCAVFLLPDRTHTWRLLRSTPHFCLCSLLHVNPVCSRFRHLHVVHRLSYPLAKLSRRLTVILCGVVCNLLVPFIAPYDLRREFTRFHTTKETVPELQASLCRVLSI